METNLTKKVDTLKGIGPKRADALRKLGIETLRDLLFYFPRSYVDLTDLKTLEYVNDGETVAVKGVISSDVKSHFVGDGRKMTVSQFTVTSGKIKMTVTLFNRKFFSDKLVKDFEYIFYGKIIKVGQRYEMKSPLIEPLEESLLQPVYRVSENVSQKMIRNIIKDVLSEYSDAIEEILPKILLEKFGLVTLCDALKKIHSPETRGDVELSLIHI